MRALIHLKRDREHEFNCGYVELKISSIRRFRDTLPLRRSSIKEGKTV